MSAIELIITRYGLPRSSRPT